ncbi:SocA family protein [Candidatus Falkowbacteria bacterium]|nr:SocA family protein [Candidatus Falkowbacteria bacterium]
MKTLKEFDHKKATQAINFLARKEGGKIDKLKVIKLIWLADRYHLRKYGRPIVNDIYFAMPYGPVASSVKDLTSFNFLGDDGDGEEKYLSEYLKQEPGHKISSIKESDTDVFSETDIETLDKIYEKYGSYKASQLVKISHEFPEWKKFKRALEARTITRGPISYSDFFSNPSGKIPGENIFNEPQEQLRTSKELFEENYKIANCWV